MNLFLDTESNGMKPEQVCQLAVLAENAGVLTGYNWFWPVSCMNPYALKKHGFSRRKLLQLADGRTFTDDEADVAALLRTGRIYGHNISSDMHALRMMGLDTRNLPTFDTMAHFSRCVGALGRDGKPKKASLSETAAHYGVTGADVEGICREIFRTRGHAHDARFDAAMTYLIILRASKNGDIRGVF